MTALRGLAVVLPVPTVLDVQDDAIVLGWMAGVHGQELLEQDPKRVLQAVGSMARTLHELNPATVPELEGDGVLVHGDFGPQNMLLDPDTYAVTALLDWEILSEPARSRSAR